MKLVQLQSYSNEIEARILAQRLEDEGIPSVVKPLYGGYGIIGVSQFIPHAVFVPEEHLERACDIAAEPAPEDLETPS